MFQFSLLAGQFGVARGFGRIAFEFLPQCCDAFSGTIEDFEAQQGSNRVGSLVDHLVTLDLLVLASPDEIRSFVGVHDEKVPQAPRQQFFDHAPDAVYVRNPRAVEFPLQQLRVLPNALKVRVSHGACFLADRRHAPAELVFDLGRLAFEIEPARAVGFEKDGNPCLDAVGVRLPRRRMQGEAPRVAREPLLAVHPPADCAQ